MHAYILRRLLYMLLLLVLVSMVSFIVIQLPPGDYLTTILNRFDAMGIETTDKLVRALEKQYGLNLPLHLQYLTWMGNLLRGDMGNSFFWNEPVLDLLLERLPFTIVLSLLSLGFVYVVAIPIGIYSATHQYSLTDYAVTVLGFVGLATPNFLLALVLMFVLLKGFGLSPGGLFSPEFELAAWSVAKLWDLLKHLPLPILVIGTAGTAAITRVMRGTLLDELKKQYVITARSKGMDEHSVVMKYPVRVALNPIVSTVGWLLPEIVSGSTIVAIVLSLPTVGPLLFQALRSQDSYLAGSTIMVLAGLTVVGTLLSDMLLAAVDPRIQFARK